MRPDSRQDVEASMMLAGIGMWLLIGVGVGCLLWLRSLTRAPEPQFPPEPYIHPYAKKQINLVEQETRAAEFWYRYTMYAKSIGCTFGEGVFCDEIQYTEEQRKLLEQWREANT